MKSSLPLRSRVDFGPGVRQRAANILRQLEVGDKVLILSQNGLPQEWLSELKESIHNEGFSSFSKVLPDGEQAKAMSELTYCWELMQDNEFTRNDTVLAIGGGAVTDIAGFCASTYLRGVNLVLMPTTLLGQVDASIGGKTAINLSAGKNLAGTFYFPHSVIVDPEFLSTLPEKELKSGMGEIVKYALIEETIAANSEYKAGPRPLFAALAENFTDGISVANEFLAPLISICIRMKLAVVLKDPFEERLRRCLNLGHTLGHGLEKVSNYAVSHGESVTVGTIFAFKLAEKLNMIDMQETQKVLQLLKTLDLPSAIPTNLDIEKLVHTVAYDKKRSGDFIKFVLPEKHCGRVNIDKSIPVSELAQAIRAK